VGFKYRILGVVDMKTILTFNCLQAERDANKKLRDERFEYPMDLYIKEVKRIDDKRAVVAFTLNSSTKPEVASFSVSGDLCIEGTAEEVSSAIAPIGKDPPVIWKNIYHECVNIMTVLAKFIEVPFPTSNIGDLIGDS
jgi:hypothetical protein